MSIFALAGAAVVGLSLAAHVWLFRALLAASAWCRRHRVALGVAQASLALAPGLRWLATPLSAPWLRPLAQWAMVPQLVLLVACACALVLGRWGRARARDGVSPRSVTELARRDLLLAAASSVAPSSALAYGAVSRREVVIEEIAVRLPRLPRALDGFTLVQVSDVHVGGFTGEAELRALEELVRGARGDLVVLTGDLVDHDPEFVPLAARWLSRLPARRGVVAIPGNHDHYAGMARVMDAMRRAGVDVLVNDARLVDEGLVLAGVDDLWGRRFAPGPGPDLSAALRAAPPDAARVLLAHNPKFFDEARPRVDLQLSGHTHGGQIAPAGLLLKYSRGLYREGASSLYVNRGFGIVGPPVRLGAPAEITRVVLVAS
ncbi:MAG: metallophosphoesterase [Polyangiaceae bacterium]|nr:metallophosphoesterase [Polyangiaceae bacterium]